MNNKKSRGQCEASTDLGAVRANAPAVSSPFNGYTRMLTPRGGILISYVDQDRHPFLSATRVFTSSCARLTAVIGFASALYGGNDRLTIRAFKDTFHADAADRAARDSRKSASSSQSRLGRACH
jgi:hypothetical protein